MDLNGNLKLADFGLSKSLDENERAFSFCGSTEYLYSFYILYLILIYLFISFNNVLIQRYMSPEMILKGGHDRKVDFYGMGALLYEMVFGFPPFYTQNTNKMF
jgi:serine/threonine protein kinase